jgi:preprotein translocase subunit SecF
LGLRATVGPGLGTSIASLVLGGSLMIALYLIFCFRLRINEFAMLVAMLRGSRA